MLFRSNLEMMRELSVPTPSKIVMVVADGLGGLPGPDGVSEMEAANIPNLDQLAAESVCGMVQHVGTGITPGSGPGHLALFGYDPLVFDIGRGVLEALGIDFDLRQGDLAARGNARLRLFKVARIGGIDQGDQAGHGGRNGEVA